VDGGSAGSSVTAGSGGQPVDDASTSGAGGQPVYDASSSGEAGGHPVDDASTADPVWGCLGHVTTDPPQSPTVELTVSFFDPIRMAPITGVGLRLCPKLDVTCSRPLNPTPALADAQGVAKFRVPASFDGYGELVETVMPARFVPSLVIFNPPITRDTNYGLVTLLTAGDINTLAAVMGSTVDPSLGVLLVRAVDCRHAPAAGVTWDPSLVDMKSRRFFFINGFPDEASVATDASGLGGILNSPVGSASVSARLLATAARIGSVSALVRPGSLTYTVVAPTP
jgi:hypothetical protein